MFIPFIPSVKPVLEEQIQKLAASRSAHQVDRPINETTNTNSTRAQCGSITNEMNDDVFVGVLQEQEHDVLVVNGVMTQQMSSPRYDFSPTYAQIVDRKSPSKRRASSGTGCTPPSKLQLHSN